MLSKESVGLVTYFFQRYPRRSAMIIGLLILAGFAEGLGVVTLFPLLQLAGDNNAAADSRLLRAVDVALGWVGLEATLGVLLTLIVIGMTFKAGFLWIAMKQVGYTMADVATDLRLMLMRSLLQARWSHFISQPAGDVSTAIGTEATRASGAYKEACTGIAAFMQLLIYTAVALVVSWQIALLALVAGMFAVLAFSTFVRRSREAGRQQTLLTRSLLARLTDALQGIKPIKAMARERHLWPLLEKETRDLNRAQQEQVLATETRKLFQEPILVLLICVGLYLALGIGDEPLAAVLVMAFLFHRLVGRVQALQLHYQGLAVGESAFWSLRRSVEEAKAERESSTGSSVPPPLEHGITLEAVEFAYGDKKVLKGVTLEIPAGRFIALVGPSGAGKTTIADLIIGLYSPQSGEVLVDGVPLGEVSLAAWRGLIGYVPQEMFLFHDTILRNVTLGDESITRAEAEQALRTADAWDFVSRLPSGLDTVIGERGSRLSGGQRQRVAIARALVGRPKLLILDEVTTALDPKTEAAICETLRKLRGEVSIVSISHQSAMREAADIVYEVSNGKVAVKHGTPALLDASVV